jgi:AcrR family transcriptional regulator
MGGGVKRRRRDAGPRLPASLEQAWGVRAVQGRGRRPTLTLGDVVRAAVAIASSDGIDVVSMNRVAQALDVGTMSLYRYVGGKDELLALMADAAFEAPPSPFEPHDGWRTGLASWAREHLAVLRRHPWVLRIPTSGPPITPNLVVWFERGLRALTDTGLGETEKLRVLLLINGFVRNEALLAADIRAAVRASGSARTINTAYGDLLSALVDVRRFPAITALLAAEVFDLREAPDAGFDFGLERLLEGVADLVRQRS